MLSYEEQKRIFNAYSASTRRHLAWAREALFWPAIGALLTALTILGALCYFAGVGICAEPLPPEDRAIRAILGEARGEGYEAMYAHACAIRNRGTLSGVYGLRVVRWVDGVLVVDRGPDRPVEEIPARLLQQATRAWYDSGNAPDELDPTHGATHWLSDYDMKHCTAWRHWIGAFRKTARIGSTTFYKKK